MTRLDIIVADRLKCSRTKAQELIAKGGCTLNNKTLTKPGIKLDKAQAEGVVIADDTGFVSRAGGKLAFALEHFGIKLDNARCLDIGASTGGFTQAMLVAGAAAVIALDNGHGQLDKSLMGDERVISMEGVDIRAVPPLPFMPGFIACDISFISLTHALAHISRLSNRADIICLIKPQFELSPDKIGNGIVKELKYHKEAVLKVVNNAAAHGLMPCGLAFSPIKGKKGNIEYLLWLKQGDV